MMKTPVTEAEFQRNSVRKSRKRKWVESLGDGGQDEDSSTDGDEDLVVDSEEDVEKKISEDVDEDQDGMANNRFEKEDAEENFVRDSEGDDGSGNDGSRLPSPDNVSVPLDSSHGSIEVLTRDLI